jgi:hypothetical protein
MDRGGRTDGPASATCQPVPVFGRRRRDAPPPVDAADAAARAAKYDRLRSSALDVGRGATPPAPGTLVVGLVVDMASRDVCITFVALGNGATAMLTSEGGGTTAAGAHATVAAATRRLLTLVDAHLALFREAPDHTVPSPGTVRLHVITTTTDHRADVPMAAFSRGEPHELGAVLSTVREVIEEVRIVTTGS